MRSNFCSFLFEGEQRRLFFTLIIEQNFEKRLRTRLTVHLVNLSGVASGRIFAIFLSLLTVLLVVIADKEHLKRSYRAEFNINALSAVC